MASRQLVLEVTMISDDDCGMYQIGEIDTVSQFAIEKYIHRFGEFGYQQITEFIMGMAVAARESIKQERLANQQMGAVSKCE